jgi:1,4-dihydroxy-2-naphthoate octaprenyltransferase
VNDAPGPWRRWILAARMRTLPAAIVPVVVGAASLRPLSINWTRSIECALIALCLQIATNYANDYSDGRRGTDDVRVGPFRLTASKLVAARSVRNMSFLFFAVAAVIGLVLASQTSWWLLGVGASAILAGWFYTGGPRPYGYYGFGELFVFLYFGLVATVGTAYVQHLSVPLRSWWLGVGLGAAACLLLEANNLRDIDGDQIAGKRTLAARLGRSRASWLVAVGVVVCAVGSGLGVAGAQWKAGLIGAVVLIGYVPVLRLAYSSRTGRELLVLLKVCAREQLALGALLGIGCYFIY